jgi:ArsR family transcriptional regulator
LPQEELDDSTSGLWQLARADLARSPGAAEDQRRLAATLARRRERSREFFASAAGEWDRMRDRLFGSRFHPLALLGLLPRDWVVADLGCGTGRVAEALAPFVRRVIAVDDSEAMLQAAGERVGDQANIELRRGELEALPLEDASTDAVTLMLALHHVVDPAAVLREAARVLRSAGRFLLVDMLPHERHEYRQEMGHVWLGFSERQIGALFAEAGFELLGFHPLPAEVAARGPSLFAASARISTRRIPVHDTKSEEQKRKGVTE